MESKNLAIIITIIIICVIIGAVLIALNQPEETQIKVLSNSSLYNGENITVQLTTENGTPIANQAVNITIIDANGGRNVQQLVTNEEGIASLTLGGVTVGNYTLECVFGGSDGYKPSNITTTLEIKQEVVKQTQKTSKSSSGYGDYDKTEFTGQYDSEGKPIYRSVHSQSKYGGQYISPGVYEEYWSENGPISGGKIR